MYFSFFIRFADALWHGRLSRFHIGISFFHYKYSLKACLEEINKRIIRDNIILIYNGNQVKLNNYHFRLLNEYFRIKENERFCYVYQVSTQPQYSYSQQMIDFVYDEIKKAPGTLLDDLKKKCTKK